MIRAELDTRSSGSSHVIVSMKVPIPPASTSLLMPVSSAFVTLLAPFIYGVSIHQHHCRRCFILTFESIVVINVLLAVLKGSSE